MSFKKLVLPMLSGMAFIASTTLVNAQVVINEILGSTTSTDTEFIELYNGGGAPVDVSNWSIELWDSDSGGSFGALDGGSPHVIPAATSIPAGGYLLLGNPEFQSIFGIVPDVALPANAIENSSYTAILKDAGASTIDSVFVTDGGAGDTANDGGVVIVPNLSVGPDGTFLPAGFGRLGDGGSSAYFLEFSPRPAPSATPGATNLIPEPGTLALMLLGLAGMATRRRI